MTDTFRALCAELTEKLDELNCLYKVPSQSALIERARAALADEPAVPQGREPAAVAGHPSDEEWQTGLPSSPGFYYVRDLLDESIGGDNRPVYVNPKHFIWGFWEQDDPEWIGLDSDITPENIQWRPIALPLAPPAYGEDLSNEELWEIYQGDRGTFCPIEFARDVIAADRSRRHALPLPESE